MSRYLCLVALLVALASGAGAVDTIYLNSGKVLRGAISNEAGDSLTLDMDDQWREIKTADIKKIIRGSAIQAPEPQPQSAASDAGASAKSMMPGATAAAALSGRARFDDVSIGLSFPIDNNTKDVVKSGIYVNVPYIFKQLDDRAGLLEFGAAFHSNKLSSIYTDNPQYQDASVSGSAMILSCSLSVKKTGKLSKGGSAYFKLGVGLYYWRWSESTLSYYNNWAGGNVSETAPSSSATKLGLNGGGGIKFGRLGLETRLFTVMGVGTNSSGNSVNSVMLVTALTYKL